MENVINHIIKNNQDLFSKDFKLEKINVGFTNKIYIVDDKYVVKICIDLENEDNFKREIDFYKLNRDNDLIPKLYYSSTDKKDVPYLYEIIEKIEGVTLYNVWHTFSEVQRENIIRQLCVAIKKIHANKGEKYDWSNTLKKEFSILIDNVKKLQIFNKEEIDILKQTISYFDRYLVSSEFVLIHNDLHFDNIFISGKKIKIIDFERSIYAPRDFELDIIYRMIRKPWKFASEETEKYTDIGQYSNIMAYIKKYYPELINTKNLYKRLAIYDMIYFLKQLIRYPNVDELKEDVLDSAKKII